MTLCGGACTFRPARSRPRPAARVSHRRDALWRAASELADTMDATGDRRYRDASPAAAAQPARHLDGAGPNVPRVGRHQRSGRGSAWGAGDGCERAGDTGTAYARSAAAEQFVLSAEYQRDRIGKARCWRSRNDVMTALGHAEWNPRIASMTFADEAHRVGVPFVATDAAIGNRSRCSRSTTSTGSARRAWRTSGGATARRCRPPRRSPLLSAAPRSARDFMQTSGRKVADQAQRCDPRGSGRGGAARGRGWRAAASNRLGTARSQRSRMSPAMPRLATFSSRTYRPRTRREVRAFRAALAAARKPADRGTGSAVHRNTRHVLPPARRLDHVAGPASGSTSCASSSRSAAISVRSVGWKIYARMPVGPALSRQRLADSSTRRR